MSEFKYILDNEALRKKAYWGHPKGWKTKEKGTPMRQKYLQKKFLHLAKIPAIRLSKEAKQRERALRIWETLCQT